MEPAAKPTTVAEYVASVPSAARPRFDELRALVRGLLPDAEEVLSYGLIGYRTGRRSPRVFVSGWRDHVAVYPAPRDADLQAELAPYRRGKGTLWFGLDAALPTDTIERAVRALTA